MALPFPIEPFYVVFRDDDLAVRPARRILVALAVAAVVALRLPLGRSLRTRAS